MIGSLAEYHRATFDCVQSDVDPIGNEHQAAKRSFTVAQPLIGRAPRSCGTSKHPPINAQDAIDVAHAQTPRRIHEHRGENSLPQS
jgi:hypothetical protein